MTSDGERNSFSKTKPPKASRSETPLTTRRRLDCSIRSSPTSGRSSTESRAFQAGSVPSGAHRLLSKRVSVAGRPKRALLRVRNRTLIRPSIPVPATVGPCGDGPGTFRTGVDDLLAPGPTIDACDVPVPGDRALVPAVLTEQHRLGTFRPVTVAFPGAGGIVQQGGRHRFEVGGRRV